MRVRFESTVDGLEVLRLHCVDTLIAAVRDSAGRGLKFELKNGILHIPLPGALARGAVSSVEIDYTSNEIGLACSRILRGDGNFIERVLGRLAVASAPELDGLRELTRGVAA